MWLLLRTDSNNNPLQGFFGIALHLHSLAHPLKLHQLFQLSEILRIFDWKPGIGPYPVCILLNQKGGLILCHELVLELYTTGNVVEFCSGILCSQIRNAHFIPTRATCNMILFRGFGKFSQDSDINLGKLPILEEIHSGNMALAVAEKHL